MGAMKKKESKMGYLKYLVLAGIVGLILVLFMVLTTVQKPASDDYPDKVLGILASKNIAQDPGFKLTMNELLGDMECGFSSTGKDTCKLPIRFQHLRTLATQDIPRIKDYEARVCKLTPSERYKADHEQLCKSLEQIYRELDSMQLGASEVGQLLRNNSPESLDSILGGFAQRIERSRQIILRHMKALSGVKWLEPALPPLPEDAKNK